MSNRAYLYNTSIATSDPTLLQQKLSEPGCDYAEVASASYIVPVSWLCCFRLGDMQTFTCRIGGDDDDVTTADVALPVVSVQQALTNIRAALTLFISIAGDEKLGKAYWQDTVRFLESLPLPYLTLDPMEVMLMGDFDEFAQQLRGALAGNLNAMRDMKELSGYVDGVLPYPPDVLYAVPTNLEESRRVNSVALDIGGGQFFWHLSKGSPARPTELASPPAVPGQPNLASIAEGLRKGMKLRKHNTSVFFGFVSADSTRRQQLKLLILTETDEERVRLLADKTLMDVLFGLFRADLLAVCKGHGFEWQGYVIASRTLITDTLRKKLDDWAELPAYGRDEPVRAAQSTSQSAQSMQPSQRATAAQNGPLSLAPVEPTSRSATSSAAGAGNGGAAGSAHYARAAANIIYYETPEPQPLFGKSTDGRIGRLRFIAFCVISHAILLAALLWAAVMVPLNGKLALLGVLPGVLALWVGIRAITLRLHDVNLSGKWLLGGILLPGLLSVLHITGGPVIGAALFWLAMIALAVWPGDSDYNSYAAQSGPEPIWVRIVAWGWLALIPLAVTGYNEQRRMEKRMQTEAASSPQTAPTPVVVVPASPQAPVLETTTPPSSPVPAGSYQPPADEDLPLPTHGGKVYGRHFLNYEIVVNSRVVDVYMTEQDHGYDLGDASGEISYRLTRPQMVRRIPLQPVGKDRMTAKIPDEAFEQGDIIHVHVTPQRKAASHFEVEVPSEAK